MGCEFTIFSIVLIAIGADMVRRGDMRGWLAIMAGGLAIFTVATTKQR